MIRHAFLATAATALTVLRDPALEDRWATPSALPDFTTAGLARHLANQVEHTATYLAAPPGPAAIPVLEHFTRNAWVTSGADSPDNVDIRRRGEHAATSTSAAGLADVVAAALTELRAVLPAQPADRIVDLGDWGLAVDDFLLTRLVELVVHVDDLAVSLDRPTPPIDPAAAAATIDLLSRVATWRHGPLPVIRALARHERSAGSIAAF
ncbi:maleylpyruvate isomerase N-terminal domain-containing protein [Dactylosporangium sp. NPDC051541]|uniref:maleylpyruvate isomerase N-terminal domain-containing protein n=1 Tax=Dactylosporangium sp. NPDC051541 TaxID=3363977 RepID=UPI0037BD5EA5